jgi:hypothetical protein
MDAQRVTQILEISKKIAEIDEKIQAIQKEREELARELVAAAGGETALAIPDKPAKKPRRKPRRKPKPKAPTEGKQGTYRKRILSIMGKSPNVSFTTAEIYDALGVTDKDDRAVLRNSLNRMVHAGELTRPGKGKYVLEKRGTTPNGKDWISQQIFKAMPVGKKMRTKDIVAKIKVPGKTNHWLQNKIWTLGRDGFLKYVSRGVYVRNKKMSEMV